MMIILIENAIDAIPKNSWQRVSNTNKTLMEHTTHVYAEKEH